jgi:hypothetical protein
MKLQKRFLRKYKGKDYYKFMVNLPPEIVENADLKEGDELEGDVRKGEIRLKKK